MKHSFRRILLTVCLAAALLLCGCESTAEEIPFSVLTELPDSQPLEATAYAESNWMEGYAKGITEDGRYLLYISNNFYVLVRVTDDTVVNIDLSSVKYNTLLSVYFDTVRAPETAGKPCEVDAKSIDFGVLCAKPVMYLYPTEPTECSVRVDLNGRLTCTYPDYGTDGWRNFVAAPDGTLTFPDGNEYYCLYWEGVQKNRFDMSSGFCVAGEDTAAFLGDALRRLGLTAREANECIIYWLPQMQDNAYNVISFQTTAYTESAALEINPAPDTLIRVFMAWYGSDTPVTLPAQTLTAPAREGFTVVEWGGSQVSQP